MTTTNNNYNAEKDTARANLYNISYCGKDKPILNKDRDKVIFCARYS